MCVPPEVEIEGGLCDTVPSRKPTGRSKKGSVQLRDANNDELIRAPWLHYMMVCWDRAKCGREGGTAFPLPNDEPCIVLLGHYRIMEMDYVLIKYMDYGLWIIPYIFKHRRIMEI